MTDTGTLVGGGLLDQDGEPNELEQDTAASELESVDPQAIGLAGGGGCSHAPGMTWAFLAAWLIRLVLLVLLVPLAHGADLQHLQPHEGGRFISVLSPDAGPRWSGQAALTAHSATQPFTIAHDNGYRRPLIDTLTTVGVGGTVNLGDWLAVGFAKQGHHVRAERNGEYQFGETSAWIVVPLARWGSPLAVRMRFDQPSRAKTWSSDLLGSRSATFSWAGEHQVGSLWVGWHSGIRMQPREEFRGLSVGNRFEGGVGAQLPLTDRIAMTLEIAGNAPLALPKTIRDMPIEATFSTDYSPTGRLHLSVFSGLGLTRAAGTPSARFGLQLRAIGHAPRDADGDGIRNLLDACDDDPEDMDGFQDKDGCPEPDNDQDGIPDTRDDCPNEPEVQNLYRDQDGCPDALATWEVVVEGPEVFEVLHDGETTVHLAPERWVATLPEGEHQVAITAKGFHPGRARAELSEGRTFSQVVLDPIVTGQLMLQVVDEDGAAVPEVEVEVEAVPVALTEGWYSGVQSIGEVTIEARAEGFDTARVTATVLEDGITTTVVTLHPQTVGLDGREIVLSDSPMFALDSDRLVDTAWLDALASWMLDHPEALVVRVEGHADSVGGSAYNLALSERRAAVVLTELVERGIEPERLVDVGSGEAHTWSGPRRMVSFTVLVHSDW